MLQIVEYNQDYYVKWNNFIEEANNGTIFHRMDFLSYHGDRYTGCERNVLWLKGENIIAVMPLCISNIGGMVIAKSPYGGSYGGIVLKANTGYSDCCLIIETLKNYLVSINVKRISITQPNRILEKKPSDTLLFAFLEKGFKFINSDITSVLSLEDWSAEEKYFKSKKRNLKRKVMKGEKLNIITKFNQPTSDFWEVLKITFKKHGISPTHSVSEWESLCKKFPGRFWNDVAYLNEKPIAGIGHIQINSVTDSSFYLCNDPEYNFTQGLSYLIHDSLIKSIEKGNKWFDFGTSSINMKARENIFRFKENFGVFGCFRHTIALEL